MTGTWTGVPSAGNASSEATRIASFAPASPPIFLRRRSGSKNVATPAAKGTKPTNPPIIVAAIAATTLRRGAGAKPDVTDWGALGDALGFSDLVILLNR